MNGDVGEHSHDKGGRSIVMNLGGSWGVLGGVIEGCFGGSDICDKAQKLLFGLAI